MDQDVVLSWAFCRGEHGEGRQVGEVKLRGKGIEEKNRARRDKWGEIKEVEVRKRKIPGCVGVGEFGRGEVEVKSEGGSRSRDDD